MKDTIRAPGPSGIAPMPSAGIFKRKNEKKSPREPDTTQSSMSSAGNPSGVFVRPSTGLRDRFGLKSSKKKEDVRISFQFEIGLTPLPRPLTRPQKSGLVGPPAT